MRRSGVRFPAGPQMHIYKHSKILALCATVVWLMFIFSAFKGFHFWYAGFVFFFWFSLATLNYRHETTLWIVKNRFKKFARFYLVLIVVGFVADFVIGQQIAHLWSYPFYDSFDDWLRLYAIIYPFGGLTILELSFLLGNLFHERFIFLPKVHNTLVRSIDLFDHIVDTFLAVVLIGGPIMYFSGAHIPLAQVVVYVFLLWAVLTTIELACHLRHARVQHNKATPAR